MITFIIILVFLLIAAATWFVGFWNNVLTLVNLLLSGLIASSFYENLAVAIDDAAPSYQLLSEFIAVWLIFILSFVVIRALTELLSFYRLKFDPVTEILGRTMLSLWIAGVFVFFMTFTFHLAPLPPHAFQQNPTDVTFGFGPDRQWLAFIQSRSRGALSESQNTTLFPAYTKTEHPDDAGQNLRVFDPQSRFIYDHHYVRQTISENEGLRTN